MSSLTPINVLRDLIKYAAAPVAQPRREQPPPRREQPAPRRAEHPRLTEEQHGARTAQAIINAGRRRRGEIPDAPAPDLNPTAAAILAAGRKRRNEQP